MKKHNYKVIIVTNQSGISRGRYTVEDVDRLHSWVDWQLKKHDAHIDDWYIAPYHPVHDKTNKFFEEDRKPETGMFQKAKHNIDFSQSYMAGDRITDLKPAVELDITSFFIRSRHEAEQDKKWLSQYNISIYDNIEEVVGQLKN